MNTTILSKEKNVNYHIQLFHLLVIAFSFVVLTGTSGCFNGGTDDNALDTEQSKPDTGGTPSNHTDNVNDFLHAPGKDTPYASWCTAKVEWGDGESTVFSNSDFIHFQGGIDCILRCA